ncbi:glycosyltransferase family 1 protein [Paracoccus sp. SCSIO 75233]|uniref:glycosyltransferase family 4 protein n=1 Tax=Paracoccus sp. SCSIO 75233 TaxID=3017782 RepID=UPI0022F0E622|nr:glycosyltransferase family 1 protein [Paracoccus sp. SCSIO 75233]WBU53143.1 glycosyltransferase family 1 protein [Paracoccus sp. SCSIO 75233]
MSNKQPVLLDVSRLVSRIGRGPLTGIDRVEDAWLDHVQSRDHLLLCRVTSGQALLPPEAGPAIKRWMAGELDELPSRPGWRERLAGRNDLRALVKTALRRMALDIGRPSGRGLGDTLAKQFPDGAVYLNIGHSNLTPALLNRLSGLTRTVMIHDTIPLDHPEYTRDGQTEVFRDRFMAAMSLADAIIAISEDTAERIDLWRRRLAVKSNPKIIVAHIGTQLSEPDFDAIPKQLDLSNPYFVTIGTIEPRKNHALLLDTWEELSRRNPQAEAPQLFIIGKRGWKNEALFRRLDQLPKNGRIVECGGLPDPAVAAIIAGSHGLLMPSHAEGFGIPLTEAAGRGIPVVSAPLPSAKEVLGDYPTYLPPDDPIAWADTAGDLAPAKPLRRDPYPTPTWEAHFGVVDTALSGMKRER